MTINSLHFSKTTALKSIIFALSFSLLTACASKSILPAKPTVEIGSVKLNKLSMSAQEFVFNLKVHNTNRFAIPVTGSNFVASFGGKEFATGSTTETVTLAAASVTEIPLNVSTQLLSSFTELVALMKSGELNFDYVIKGKLNVALAMFPLGIPFESKGNILSLTQK